MTISLKVVSLSKMIKNIYTKFNFSKKYKIQLTNFVKTLVNIEMGGDKVYDGLNTHYQQNPNEIVNLIFELKRLSKKRKLKKYLEIGYSSGINLNLLNKFFNFEKLVGVDILGSGINTNTFFANLRFKNMILVCGDSTEKKTINNVQNNGPYDIIFIDGDHKYNSVRQDYINYSKFLTKKGIIIFHDIKFCDTKGTEDKGVPFFWENLKKKEKKNFIIKEFYDPKPFTKTGIGMLIKK